ncbi:hypothetical protein KQI86_19270 [Clostridium sp. MSJ-11]|uniref:Uncharacterized protein n=1 Tax=Clostridium mobile TaxID=2841512 RepID=A0ABS6EPY9_9CLOT|nr:hypothetical protein [Clostridium mobile]MBU5486445.1 hypothetical protein [Clostridium mobile]
MNTVNSDNFNETIEGYKSYTKDFMYEVLKEKGYKESQIKEILEVMDNGFHWSKDDMTMEQARRYKRKY